MPPAEYSAFSLSLDGLRAFHVSESAPAYTPRRPGTSIGLQKTEGTDLVRRLRQGLPVSAFDRLRRALGVSAGVLAEVVHIPVRTLSRRRQQGRFDVSESERLFRIAALFDHAVDVMGDEDRARDWLTHPVRGLGGAEPLAFADTEPGARQVHDLLGRIEHGVFT